MLNKGSSKFKGKLALTAIALVIATPVFASMTIDEIRQKCIAYGASPGSNELVMCISMLDEKEQKKREFERLAKEECDTLTNALAGMNLAIQGLSANKPREDCLRRLEKRILGIGSNERECFREGRSVICRDR